jgi:hypothetical protein
MGIIVDLKESEEEQAGHETFTVLSFEQDEIKITAMQQTRIALLISFI